MRYARFAIALLGLAVVLSAADPFAGTWKLNTSKSKSKTGKLPKEQTVTITEEGSNLDVTIKGISAEGTPISSHYAVPAAGGDGKIIESPYDAVSSERIGPTRREITYSKGGKVVMRVHTRVSANGKTLTATVKGTDLAGKPVDGESVLEKQ
jgi:hypothetical protein